MLSFDLHPNLPPIKLLIAYDRFISIKRLGILGFSLGYKKFVIILLFSQLDT